MPSSAAIYGIGVSSLPSTSIASAPIVALRAPTAGDVRSTGGLFEIGQLWVDTTAGAAYILTNLTPTSTVFTATWLSI